MQIMPRLFTTLSGPAVLLLALLSPTLAAEEPDQAVREVIMSQIVAFADDDAAQAWEYASDGIQQQFSSPESFLGMVRSAYPAVYRAGSVQFGELIPHPGFMVQSLVIMGPDGRYWDSYYTMVENGGNWRIGGVVLKESKPAI